MTKLAWTMAVLALMALQSLAQSIYEPYTFTTLAGNAGPAIGSADGTGSAARFNFPRGVAMDTAGNVYVADTSNNTIRKVTPSGVVTTLAGLAQFDDNGNPLTDSADGTGTAARFNFPSGVAVDSAGNVYVADTSNNTIRKVTPSGVVTTLAGRLHGSTDGAGSAARFNGPSGLAVDSAGNVYVADTYNHTIRKVTPAGEVTTLAGLAQSDPCYCSSDGTGSAARFAGPFGVAVDGAGNVYVADAGAIRKVTPEGVVTSLAGLAGSAGSTDGTGNAARFGNPSGVAGDSAGNVYVADSSNTIRKVTQAGVVTTLAGVASIGGSADGTGSDARFSFGYYGGGVAVDRAGNVYVADHDNNTIRKVTPAGVVTTLAGFAQFDAGGNPVNGSTDGTGSNARFSGPRGVAVDSAGIVYVADSDNNAIRKVTPLGVVTTLAGRGTDEFDVYRGSEDGTGSAARFNWPRGVAVDSAGIVYVTDTGNNTIRKVTPAGVVTTLAGLAGEAGSADGTGNAARFGQVSGFPYQLTGVAVDGAGNVYVADSDNCTIRKVTSAGVVTTLAGLAGISGSADGTGTTARFGRNGLSGIGASSVAVDSAGRLYVADSANNTIRKGYPAPRILSSGPGFGFNGGQFGFNLTGPAGRLVVVEGSTDLVSWLPRLTNTFSFPSALNFSDPQSGASSHRFYRTVSP